jgi:predicted ATP-dependent serine protease
MLGSGLREVSNLQNINFTQGRKELSGTVASTLEGMRPLMKIQALVSTVYGTPQRNTTG